MHSLGLRIRAVGTGSGQCLACAAVLEAASELPLSIPGRAGEVWQSSLLGAAKSIGPAAIASDISAVLNYRS